MAQIDMTMAFYELGSCLFLAYYISNSQNEDQNMTRKHFNPGGIKAWSRYTLIERLACRGAARKVGRSMMFTLIELLVVVAVIAILAAMLLPALSRAKYTAKNVICIGNQSQIARGVLLYTGDYDSFYPGRSDTVYQESADTVQRDASTTNYLVQLRPYFSAEGLRGTWVCPLARSEFQEGGGTWYNRTRNLATTTSETITSYAHYYGRIEQTGDSSSQKCGWGLGPFQPERAMLKAGQSFIMDEYWTADFAEYNVLTSDSMWLWNSSTLVYTHRSFAEPPGLDWSDQYYRYKVDPAVAVLDMNYATNDGAVQSVRGIRQYDRNITLTRRGGSWGWAWMLPPPE